MTRRMRLNIEIRVSDDFDVNNQPRITMKAQLAMLLLFSAACGAVVHLNENNFKKHLSSHEFTLVYMYSSSCGYCKEFTPIFEELSKHPTVLKYDLSFAKIDGVSYGQFRQMFGVHSYPSLLLFYGDLLFPIQFRKQRTEKDLLDFLSKKLISGEENKVPNANDILKSQVNYAVFYGKNDTKEYRLMQLIAHRYEYLRWYRIESVESYIMAGENQNMRITFSDLNVTRLEDALKMAYAKLQWLTEQSWLRMFERKQFSLVYLNKKMNSKVSRMLDKVAKKHYDVNVLQIDGENSQFIPAVRKLGVVDSQNIIAVDLLYSAIFVMNLTYTQENMDIFIAQCRNHSWEVYRRSEKAQKPSKLTRENFDVKMGTAQDVILFLYSKKTKSSKDLMSLFIFVERYFQRFPGVQVLRCDADANEVEDKLGFLLKVLPKVVFFRNGMKDYPIHYTQDVLSAQGVIDFVRENTTFDLDQEEL